MGGSYRDGVGHTAVGWVGHTGVKWVSGLCNGGVGST